MRLRAAASNPPGAAAPIRRAVRIRWLPFLLLLGFVSGCSAPGSNQPPPVVSIRLTEYKVTPAEITLDAGTYSFTGLNRGGISHALELTGNGIDAHTKDFSYQPGHAESFSITLKPGTYQFFCPVDGHRAMGMVGTLVIR